MFCIHYTFNAYRALLVYLPILVRHKLVKTYTVQKYIQVYLVLKSSYGFLFCEILSTSLQVWAPEI